MNSTLTAQYSWGNNEKKEEVVSYIGPFEYIREKCSACPRAERCMLPVDQRARCLGPVRNGCVTSYKEVGHLLDKLECGLSAGFISKKA